MAEWPGEMVTDGWPGTADDGTLTDPHEIEYAKAKQGQLSDIEIQDNIRQYRSLKAADQGKPTIGGGKLPKLPAKSLQVGTPSAQAQEAPPEASAALDTQPQPTIPAQPSAMEPRVGMSDLLGPTGYNMLAGGLAMGALTPGPLPLKIAGGIAGAGAAYLGDEGTRRLQEQIGEVPGYIAGLALSVLSGGFIGGKTAKAGKTPSHPTQFENVTVESPETKPIIPAQPSEGLFATTPKGGAYSTQELITDPSSRIMGEHQFSTGSGESLFGQGLGDFQQHVEPPMAPTTIPGMAPNKAWISDPLHEGVNLNKPQEKYPTLTEKPIPKGEEVPSQGLYTQEQLRNKAANTPQPKPAGIDTGSIDASGGYVPPKDYIEPPTPGRFKQAFNAELQRWGQELPVLKNQSDSPVISSVEATHVYVEDYMESFAKQPWLKSLMKYGDNTKVAPLEKKWIEAHKAGQDPKANMPDDFKQMFTRMDALLDEENAILRRRGITEVPKADGPYMPRLTDEDFHLMRTIARQQDGAKTAQSIGSFGAQRTMESLHEGISKGVTYKDWRISLLLREARGAVLRSTDIMMTDLEKAGVLHRTKEAAEAASLAGKAYPAEGLPFSPKGGNWWVRSPEERQFMLQNLRHMGSGALADIRGWAQQWLRNPSLVNPWPHIVKNMGLKQMQQAVASGLNPAGVLKQTFKHRWGTPDMLDEFKQVMPFTESGRTVWELIEKTGPKTTIQQMSRVPGMLNKYASKKIFAEWDPAMRYGLWREYVRKGMTPQEAANHTWIDLIRYGTRSERIDAWNSVPFNFFVPWRVGTLRTMNKALQSSPVRFGLFMGAVDTIREMDYRYNGRWTHLPYDYIERPIMTLIKDGKTEALTTLGATIIAGPGGEYMFRSIQNVINEIQGKGGIGDLRTLAWGIAQVYDLWPQYEAWMKDGKSSHLTDMLGLVLLGRHATPYGGPRRFGELIPEGLIRKHPLVKEGEMLREAFKEHSEVKGNMKMQRDVEKYKQPWQTVD